MNGRVFFYGSSRPINGEHEGGLDMACTWPAQGSVCTDNVSKTGFDYNLLVFENRLDNSTAKTCALKFCTKWLTQK